MTELLSRGLPKWPQMLVTGMPVTHAQATEIIRRTDSFFNGYGGNDYKLNDMMRMAFMMPPTRGEYAPDAYTRLAAWQQAWDMVETEYVRNDWLASAYVGGCHGWCHPDGHIGYSHNVGKWPSCTDIYTDWRALARAFPFLHIDVTLMDREHCEDGGTPIIGFQVRGTEIVVVDTDTVLHTQHPQTPHQELSTEDWFDLRYRNQTLRTTECPGYECDITLATITAYSEYALNLFRETGSVTEHHQRREAINSLKTACALGDGGT